MDFPEVRNYFWRERQVLVVSGKSRTKQAPMQACDINSIIKRWESTGVVEHVMESKPTYGDFSTVEDYLYALNKVSAAESDFAALPAHIRDRCENDPAKFLAFVQNPESREELVELGLEELAVLMHGPPAEPDAPPQELPEPPVVAPEKPAPPVSDNPS